MVGKREGYLSYSHKIGMSSNQGLTQVKWQNLIAQPSSSVTWWERSACPLSFGGNDMLNVTPHHNVKRNAGFFLKNSSFFWLILATFKTVFGSNLGRSLPTLVVTFEMRLTVNLDHTVFEKCRLLQCWFFLLLSH